MHTNAVLFSKRFNQQETRSLAQKLILLLCALWQDAPHRNPWIEGGFAVFYNKPECSAFSPEEVATDTGYELSRFTGTQVVGRTYRLADNSLATKVPDLSALAQGKKASFVAFREAGYSDRRFFGNGMTLAATLAALGYYGGIRCYSDCIKNEQYNNPERCSLTISEEGLLTVQIRWGEETLVGPLFDLCRAEGFLEADDRDQWEKPRKTA